MALGNEVLERVCKNVEVVSCMCLLLSIIIIYADFNYIMNHTHVLKLLLYFFYCFRALEIRIGENLQFRIHLIFWTIH